MTRPRQTSRAFRLDVAGGNSGRARLSDRAPLPARTATCNNGKPAPCDPTTVAKVLGAPDCHPAVKRIREENLHPGCVQCRECGEWKRRNAREWKLSNIWSSGEGRAVEQPCLECRERGEQAKREREVTSE